MLTDELFERVEIVEIDELNYGRRSYGSNRAIRLRLYINPRRHDLIRLAQQVEAGSHIRFIIDIYNDVYMWYHSDVIHNDVEHAASIESEYDGYLEPGEIIMHSNQPVKDLASMLRSNTHILDLMGGAHFKVKRVFDLPL